MHTAFPRKIDAESQNRRKKTQISKWPFLSLLCFQVQQMGFDCQSSAAVCVLYKHIINCLLKNLFNFKIITKLVIFFTSIFQLLKSIVFILYEAAICVCLWCQTTDCMWCCQKYFTIVDILNVYSTGNVFLYKSQDLQMLVHNMNLHISQFFNH